MLSATAMYANPLKLITIAFTGTIVLVSPAMADVDLATKFRNEGTIGNTRHNLTQRATSSLPADGQTVVLSGVNMDPYRNDYGEVCVYCHTPHGANTTAGAPLWNRALPNASSFTTYTSSTLTQTPTAPGANSLVCLSCHDGQTAVDAIYNMPGSGKYSATPDNAFLNTNWNNATIDATVHLGLDAVTPGNGCLACHASTAGFVGSGATDFTVFAIGKDLTNDHPIGVTFPGGADYNSGTSVKGSITYFDKDGSGNLSKGDPRFYDSGGGPEVECSSCHDPHGVPSGAPGSKFNPTFLRVSNAGSALCLTCHAK